MPTYRKLHLKTTESLDINEMPDDTTRLLWVLLPLGLDAEGRGLDNPSWVKSKVFPLRTDISTEQVESMLCWFDQRGMITRYVVDGRRYFLIPTWHRYQGDTSKESGSHIPPPNSGVTPELLQSNSLSDAQVDADADAQVDADAEQSATGAVAQLYQNNIGVITPIIAEKIKAAVDDYPGSWFVRAFEIAVENNARNWGYVTAILERWKTQGFQDDGRKSKARSPAVSEPAGFATLRAAARRASNE